MDMNIISMAKEEENFNNFNNKFAIKEVIADEDLTLSILKSDSICVISLYRSNTNKTLATHLEVVVPDNGNCLVIGDFNLCSRKSSNHAVFTLLRSMGFKLLVAEATHFDGGHLNQAWFRKTENCPESHYVQIYSPYYTCKDHDAILFSFYDQRTSQGELSQKKAAQILN